MGKRKVSAQDSYFQPPLRIGPQKPRRLCSSGRFGAFFCVWLVGTGNAWISFEAKRKDEALFRLMEELAKMPFNRIDQATIEVEKIGESSD